MFRRKSLLHCVGSRDKTRAIRLENKWLYSLSHLAGPAGMWSKSRVMRGNPECLEENHKGTRPKSCDLSFLKKMGLLGRAFVSLPGVVKEQWIYFRSFIVTGYCYCLDALTERRGFATCGLSTTCNLSLIVHFICVTPPNPLSIKCLMLWIKLAIAWNFSQPPFRFYSPRPHAF